MKIPVLLGIVSVLVGGLIGAVPRGALAQNQPEEAAPRGTYPGLPPAPPPPPTPQEAAPAENAAPEPVEPPAPAPEAQPQPAPAVPAPALPVPIRPSVRARMAPRMPGRPIDRKSAAPAPAVVPQPVPDNSPKNGETPDQPAKFDFKDADLSVVIESLAKMTGKNFDVDPTIGTTKVTIITHNQIPPDMAYDVLAAVLNARGFSLIPTLDGKLIRVVPAGDASGDKIPMNRGTDVGGKLHDEVSTHIVTVEHADAAEVSTILKELGSKGASVDAYARTNTLIITDTADGLKRMFEFLKEVDVAGFDTQMEIFTLEYARAELLANQIQDVLNETGTPTSPRPGMPAQPMRPSQPQRVPPSRPSVPGQATSIVVGNHQETLRIVPDERLNSLIVIATSGLMEKTRDLVAKLDTPTPYEANNMNVYKLLNADAKKVDEALNAIIGTGSRSSGGRSSSSSSSSSGHSTSGSSMSGKSMSGSSMGGGYGGGGAGGAMDEIQPFEKKVIITTYEQSNALLILATPQDYKLIKELIAQLDVPQRQVMIEAVILNVSLEDQYGLSVDAASIKGADVFGVGNSSNISTLASAANLATQIASGTAGIGMAEQVLGLGQNGGLSVGVYDHLTAKIGAKKYKIPFVPFLIKSLQTLTDADVLSQPTLTTQDNQEANIVIGQEIPVPTVPPGYSYNPYSPGGTNTTTNNAAATPYYGMSTYGAGIDREDVGVKMKVKPHINEGDYVSMETEIEVSEAVNSDVGINANTLGPTFNKSKVTNNVVVKDGSTSVVGGLIKETVGHNKTQTPFLGDIPLLGMLFKTKNDDRKKQDVVVLMTPHIIKEGADFDRVSEYKMNEFRDQNVDVLFEKGIIKRVKKSRHMHDKYWPSIERSKRMEQHDESFGRGDIERE